jgi:hypothetical protein
MYDIEAIAVGATFAEPHGETVHTTALWQDFNGDNVSEIEEL